jgi:hypothetical protein
LPDFHKSGSTTPITAFLFFFFHHGAEGAEQFYFRVPQPRFGNFGFLKPDFANSGSPTRTVYYF